MTDKFVNLHTHSTYSFTDGYGLPEQYMKRVKELGQIGIGLTDHGNISGHYKWYKEANDRNLIPILGCEMYMKPEDVEDTRKYYHVTVLAINEEGYKNLLKLVTTSWENFYRKPLTTIEDLFKHQKGLVITSGCPSGRIPKLVETGIDNAINMHAAEQEMIRMNKNIEHFYIEFAPWSYPDGKKIIKPLYEMAKKNNIPMLASMDTHYVMKEQSEVQEILLCIQSGDKMDNPNRWTFDQNDFYLKTRKEMENSFKAVASDLDFTEALDNTVKITEMVDFKFPTATQLKYPIADSKKESTMRKICERGLKEKGLDKLPEYIERMDYELDIIAKKDFIDYFLIMGDLTNWAKKEGILVGPARGSSAGSLVCFLMKITEVDPIKYDLIFERFIDINRLDMPDIDVDFEDERRPDVKRYLENKYGKNHVGQIATFATFKGKSIIQYFGAIYKLPFEVSTKLKSIIIERSGGDSRASYTIMDTFEQFSLAKEYLKKYPMLKHTPALEGQLKNLSSHASGIVVSNEPLTDFCAIYQNKGETLISMDYYDASSIGLIKLDILGLNTLTAVSKAIKMIKKEKGVDIDIYNLDLEDPKVLANFRDDKKLFGIFQFDGQSMNQVCRQVKPETFEDLSSINALSRPGPMHGLDEDLGKPITTVYIMRKNKQIPISYSHALLEPITKDTYGVVIYQEQVMRVMREVGKMSWADTASIRKLISRSQGVERFNTFKEKFAVGAKENGLTDHEIDSIWSAICTHGSWSFNKSHSISYSIIGYWTMWLKTYYPIEYYAAMMSTVHNETKLKKILKEYRREGFDLLPIDINESKETFKIDGDNLRIGFSEIKGIGEGVAQTIVEGQPYNNFDEFKDRNKGKKIGKKAMSLLAKMGAFKSIGGAGRMEHTLFGIDYRREYDEEMTIEEQIKICPLSVTFDVFEKWEEFLKENIGDNISLIEHLDPKEKSQTIIGIVYDKNLKDVVEEALSRGLPKPIHEEGKTKYCNFVIEDNTDFMTIRIPLRSFGEHQSEVFENLDTSDVVLIRGKMGDGIRMFFCNEFVNLTKLKKKMHTNEELTTSEKVMLGITKRPYYGKTRN